MSASAAGALPLPHSFGRSSETTPGGQEEVRWVVVAESLAPLEAEIIKSKLESYHIPAIVYQESIGSVMGLTVGPLGAANVLVPEPLAESALSVLLDSPAAEDDSS